MHLPSVQHDSPTDTVRVKQISERIEVVIFLQFGLKEREDQYIIMQVHNRKMIAAELIKMT